jgi:hypothetical protein
MMNTEEAQRIQPTGVWVMDPQAGLCGVWIYFLPSDRLSTRFDPYLDLTFPPLFQHCPRGRYQFISTIIYVAYFSFKGADSFANLATEVASSTGL